MLYYKKQSSEKLLIYTQIHTDIQIITLVLNMLRTFHGFPKKLMSDQASAQLGKLNDLKITMNYLHVGIVLEVRTLVGHNMFNRRDEEHKEMEKKKKKILSPLLSLLLFETLETSISS